MRIPTFIGLTSLLLCTWLGVAFFREVPTGIYPLIEGSIAGKPFPQENRAVAMASENLPLEP